MSLSSLISSSVRSITLRLPEKTEKAQYLPDMNIEYLDVLSIRELVTDFVRTEGER